MIATRRRLFQTVLPSLALVATSRSNVFAQVSGLELVAPSGPGSGYDQLARTMQSVLTTEKLATGIQIQNAPGGGGTVGLAQYATGRRLGPSMLVVGFALVGGVLTTRAPISLGRLIPVARLMGEDDLIVVPANSDIRNVEDLASKLKANPGTVRWAGGSIGGIDHVLAGLIAKAVGVDPTKINFVVHAGGSEVLASVLGGRVTVGVSGPEEFRTQIKAGRLRPIAVSGENRIPDIDAPTLREAGVDVVLANWRGLMTHPDLAEAERKAVTDVVGTMVGTQAWKDALTRRGWSDAYLDAGAFRTFLTAETARVAEVLKDVGLVK